MRSVKMRTPTGGSALPSRILNGSADVPGERPGGRGGGPAGASRPETVVRMVHLTRS